MGRNGFFHGIVLAFPFLPLLLFSSFPFLLFTSISAVVFFTHGIHKRIPAFRPANKGASCILYITYHYTKGWGRQGKKFDGDSITKIITSLCSSKTQKKTELID